MNSTEALNLQNIPDLERQLCEKLHELQNNTDALQIMQKQLLETRHALYSTELLLQKEREISQGLRMQLKVTMNAANELQQQQTKNQIEDVQLRVKYDAMSKQYDSLMNQATVIKAQEIEYKIKVQVLENKLCQENMTNKSLEQTLKEFERNSLRNLSAIEHNIASLKQEHEYLQKSCENVINLNQRLQTVGLCTYAIHQKDKEKIKNLENMLSLLSVKDVETVNQRIHPNVKHSSSQFI